jgi:hypothetical protein
MVEDDTVDEAGSEDACLECEIEAVVECEIQNRLMIGRIVQFLHSRRAEPDHNEEVQKYLDCAAISAALRLERIFNSDRQTELD